VTRPGLVGNADGPGACFYQSESFVKSGKATAAKLMSDIFLSYAREDLERARQLAQAMERKGWDVFWDQTIPAGKNWRSYLGEKLEQASCVVVAWSKVSVVSNWVLEEADSALEKSALVPVLLETVRPPLGFRQVQAEDLSAWDGTDEFPAFQKLLRDIESIIGPKPSESKAVTVAATQEWAQELLSKTLDSQQRQLKEAGTVFCDKLKDGSQGPEMVVIPAGTFKMGDVQNAGSDSEKPVHVVHIQKPFAIGRYQVTFDDFDEYVKATGAIQPGDIGRDLLESIKASRSDQSKSLFDEYDVHSEIGEPALKDDKGWGRGRRPVIHVSWNEAVEYAKWLADQTGMPYRLPTEAEWEYAARSGGRDENWAGTSRDQELSSYAWYDANSGGKTQPVGAKKPNSLGLFDMSGNVWEWVEDCWHENYNNAPADGSAWLREGGGDCGQRVLRGGSWFSVPSDLRVSFHGRADFTARSHNIGFRLARDLE
jgi:formylglycine-generating enzyme required for sulfatase activity